MKHCFKCGAEKPLTEFYKHPKMKDGRVNKCKECNKKDVRENRAAKVDYYRAYDANRFQNDPRVRERNERYKKTESGKAVIQKSRKKWINKNPEARSAHVILGNAVKNGRIKKPHNCSRCGKYERSRKIHAHHHDYALPLDVTWLCAQCHTDEHKDD